MATKEKVKGRSRRASDVVYTQPKPFQRGRFLLHIATVVAVVLALVFGMTIFFKVQNITVVGSEKYSQWDIAQASGIQNGENLLTLSRAKISGKITTALPYVKKVRVGITLPDTVNLQIEELEVYYSIQDEEEQWWLMAADGKILEKTTEAKSLENTRVLGVQLSSPEPGKQAVAAEPVPEETMEDGQTVPVTVKGSERLQAAVSLLKNLESNGIIGKAASIDVEDLTGIELWYGQQYQVFIGDTSRLDYKLASMKAAVSQMNDYQSGELDVSFTIWPDQVGFTPFQ